MTQLAFTHSLLSHIRIVTPSHLFNLFPTYSDQIMLAVHRDSSQKSFSPQNSGTDKQHDVNPWKCVVENGITFRLHYHQFTCVCHITLYCPTLVHYTGYTKSHISYCSDAFRCPQTPKLISGVVTNM